jgi:hypothetical protein
MTGQDGKELTWKVVSKKKSEMLRVKGLVFAVTGPEVWGVPSIRDKGSGEHGVSGIDRDEIRLESMKLPVAPVSRNAWTGSDLEWWWIVTVMNGDLFRMISGVVTYRGKELDEIGMFAMAATLSCELTRFLDFGW